MGALPPRPGQRRIGFRAALQWAGLLALSTLLVVLFETAALPAALLMGTMGAAVIVSAAGWTLQVPARPNFVAQAIIGCMIARALPFSICATLAQDWPLFAAGVVSVIGVSTLIGCLMTRWQILPGTVAIWGSSPGAATAMTLMADACGADIRLVAVMQYLRVICVSVVASLVARFWVPGVHQQSVELIWFPPVAPVPFIETMALAGVCVVAARRLRIPAGPLILPLLTGMVLQGGGWLTIELPPWLLAVSYCLVGWTIGLRFNRPVLAYAARVLPRILASILTLILICGVFAFLLTTLAGIEPLTAYLATSPGGADSVAIIAASSRVDLPFVMAMQTARFLVVLIIYPPPRPHDCRPHHRTGEIGSGWNPRSAAYRLGFW